MTTTTAEPRTLAAPAGFLSDVMVMTGRSVRGLLREPESFIPALTIPLFFFVVQLGALGKVAERAFGISDYAAFQLPVAVLFAAANTSGGNALVLDIANGYWDKLSLTPVHRSALVIGTLLGEVAAVIGYSVLLIGFGWAIGVRFAGPEVPGALGLLALTVLFGVGFAAISVAIALATGSIRATQTAFVIFFPLLFLTPGTLPRPLMTGWFKAAVAANPITYVLEAARSFLFRLDAVVIAKGVLAVGLFCAFTFSLTLLAFRRRARLG
ncbi:MAG TPA: ABC transporter permease [Actinomycetes bacterium]|jgi:ABC-2 type transport system permease protein|nr:ABC transporter permease [Actinomycetes bacterium]